MSGQHAVARREEIVERESDFHQGGAALGRLRCAVEELRGGVGEAGLERTAELAVGRMVHDRDPGVGRGHRVVEPAGEREVRLAGQVDGLRGR